MKEFEIDPNTGLPEPEYFSTHTPGRGRSSGDAASLKDYIGQIGVQQQVKQPVFVGEHFDSFIDRFDSQITDYDQIYNLENFRGEMQSSFEKYMQFIPKALTRTGTAAIDMGIAPIYGLLEAGTRKAFGSEESFQSMMINNSLSLAMDIVNEYVNENIFRTYMRDSYHDKGWFEQLYSPEGMATQVADAAGFAAGSMVSMFTGVGMVGHAAKLPRILTTATKLGSVRTAAALKTGFEPIASQFIRGSVSAFGEGNIEARFFGVEFLDEMREQIGEELLSTGQYNLEDPYDEFRLSQDIEEQLNTPHVKAELGRGQQAILKGNVPLLLATNTLTLGMFGKPFRQFEASLRPKMRVQSMGKSVRQGAPSIGMEGVSEGFQEFAQEGLEGMVMDRVLEGEEVNPWREFGTWMESSWEHMVETKEGKQAVFLGALMGSMMATGMTAREHQTNQRLMKGTPEVKAEDISFIQRMMGKKPSPAKRGLIDASFADAKLTSVNYTDIIEKNEDGKLQRDNNGNFKVDASKLTQLTSYLKTKESNYDAMVEAVKKGDEKSFNKYKNLLSMDLLSPYFQVDNGMEVLQENVNEYFKQQIEENPNITKDLQAEQKRVMDFAKMADTLYKEATEAANIMVEGINNVKGKNNEGTRDRVSMFERWYVDALAKHLILSKENRANFKDRQSFVENFESTNNEHLQQVFNKTLTDVDVLDILSTIERGSGPDILSRKQQGEYYTNTINNLKQLTDLISKNNPELSKTDIKKDIMHYLNTKHYIRLETIETKVSEAAIDNFQDYNNAQSIYDEFLSTLETAKNKAEKDSQDYAKKTEEDAIRNQAQSEKNTGEGVSDPTVATKADTETIAEQDPTQVTKSDIDSLQDTNLEKEAANISNKESINVDLLQDKETAPFPEDAPSEKGAEKKATVTKNTKEPGKGPVNEVEVGKVQYKAEQPHKKAAYKSKDLQGDRKNILTPTGIPVGANLSLNIDTGLLPDSIKPILNKLRQREQLSDTELIELVENLPIALQKSDVAGIIESGENYFYLHSLPYFYTSQDLDTSTQPTGNLKTLFNKNGKNLIDELIKAIASKNTIEVNNLVKQINAIATSPSNIESFKVITYADMGGKIVKLYGSNLAKMIMQRLHFIENYRDTTGNPTVKYKVEDKNVSHYKKTDNLDKVDNRFPDEKVQYGIIMGDGSIHTSKQTKIEGVSADPQWVGAVAAVLPDGHVTTLHSLRLNETSEGQVYAKRIYSVFEHIAEGSTDKKWLELKEAIETLGYHGSRTWSDLSFKERAEVKDNDFGIYIDENKKIFSIRVGAMGWVNIPIGTNVNSPITGNMLGRLKNVSDRTGQIVSKYGTVQKLLQDVAGNAKVSLKLGEGQNTETIKILQGFSPLGPTYTEVNRIDVIKHMFQTRYDGTQVAPNGEHIYAEHVNYEVVPSTSLNMDSIKGFEGMMPTRPVRPINTVKPNRTKQTILNNIEGTFAKVKVNHYVITINKNGTMTFKNGNPVNNSTIENKALKVLSDQQQKLTTTTNPEVNKASNEATDSNTGVKTKKGFKSKFSSDTMEKVQNNKSETAELHKENTAELQQHKQEIINFVKKSDLAAKEKIVYMKQAKEATGIKALNDIMDRINKC